MKLVEKKGVLRFQQCISVEIISIKSLFLLRYFRCLRQILRFLLTITLLFSLISSNVNVLLLCLSVTAPIFSFIFHKLRYFRTLTTLFSSLINYSPISSFVNSNFIDNIYINSDLFVTLPSSDIVFHILRYLHMCSPRSSFDFSAIFVIIPMNLRHLLLSTPTSSLKNSNFVVKILAFFSLLGFNGLCRIVFC